MIPSFNEYCKTLKMIEQCIDSSKNLDEFFENIEECGGDIGAVMTNNIAGITLPIGSVISRYKPTRLFERAPSDPKAEEFIQKNKKSFEERYGDNWEQILYATAWKLFPEK